MKKEFITFFSFKSKKVILFKKECFNLNNLK